MKKILLIEDDENLSRGISFAFTKDGFDVRHAGTLKMGWEIFNQYIPDIIILDLGLPDGNGLDFCKKLRTISQVPIIVLTACDLETDEVAGFLAGADDYVTKPFSLAILRARVERIFHRLNEKSSTLIFGHFKLDVDVCKLFKGEQEVVISPTEFKLLKYLMTHAGQVLSKEQILDVLWDNQGSFVDENTLSVNISRLRSKIEVDAKNPQVIKTIRGIGYIWVKEQG